MSRHLRLVAILAAALALPASGAAGQGNACAPCDSTQRAALDRTLRGQLAEVQAELARLAPELQRLGAELAAGEPMTDTRASLFLRENELRGIESQLQRAITVLHVQQRRGARPAKPRTMPRSEFGLLQQAPVGYIGVSFSGSIEPRPGERRFFFHDYPQIVSVDAGSPAARGGLQAGDVLVMLGGTELKGRGLDLNVVLRPGAKVPVRFRRDGTIRSSTLVVARAPSSYRFETPAPRAVEPAIAPEIVPPPAPAPQPSPAVDAAPAVAPLPPIFASGGMTGGVAGAEVARVQGNLREMLGVDGGLLVLDVGLGSPAFRSGLRSGDVIQRADGETVRTPLDLLRAVRDAREPAVKLEIVRKKERKVVVLRW
jgi:membrane-associated protease RseP (regulator of RpoE activity)